MGGRTRSGLIISLIGLVICIGTILPGVGNAQTAQTTVNLLAKCHPGSAITLSPSRRGS